MHSMRYHKSPTFVTAKYSVSLRCCTHKRAIRLQGRVISTLSFNTFVPHTNMSRSSSALPPVLRRRRDHTVSSRILPRCSRQESVVQRLFLKRAKDIGRMRALEKPSQQHPLIPLIILKTKPLAHKEIDRRRNKHRYFLAAPPAASAVAVWRSVQAVHRCNIFSELTRRFLCAFISSTSSICLLPSSTAWLLRRALPMLPPLVQWINCVRCCWIREQCGA